MNPRSIKLAQAKLESKVAKEVRDLKKEQAARRKRAAKLTTDYAENEVIVF